MVIFLLALVNFIAAFIQAASGFGYAIFAMFLMPMIIPFRQSSVISAAIIVVIGLQMTVSLRTHIRIRKILIPMAFCILSTGLGIHIIRVTDPGTMRMVMGVFLIFLSIYFYLSHRYRFHLKAGFLQGMVIGLLTGISTGMFNIVGPFLMLYYYDNCEDSLEFKANIEFSFLIAGAYSLVLNLFYVKLDAFLVQVIAASALGALLAGIIGLQVFRKVDKVRLKYIIISILPVMGLILILK